MFFRAQLTLCLLLLVPAVVLAQGDFSPRTGLLLLRNGNLIEGEVTQAGDYYIVTTNQASEIRLPKNQVEGVCRNLDEAYIFKLATMHGTGLKAQLEMAEWCLRHKLYDKAPEHLAEAEVLDPKNSLLPLLNQRLQAGRDEKTKPTRIVQAAAPVLAIDLDRVEENLPAGAVEKFTAAVQPILMNRCASGGCHGAQTTSTLQIIRPLAGQLIQRRATQRNLISALKYIDKEFPERSPLLTIPLEAHGGGKAVFDANSREQALILAGWVQQTLEPIAAPPASLQPAIARLTSASGTAHSAAEPVSDVARGAVNANLSNLDERSVHNEAVKKDLPDAPFRPRDPFDPEIFNRRLQAKQRQVAAPIPAVPAVR